MQIKLLYIIATLVPNSKNIDVPNPIAPLPPTKKGKNQKVEEFIGNYFYVLLEIDGCTFRRSATPTL